MTATGRVGAPAVVPAHGFGCDQNLWRPATPPLERDVAVVRYGHLGANSAASRPSAG